MNFLNVIDFFITFYASGIIHDGNTKAFTGKQSTPIKFCVNMLGICSVHQSFKAQTTKLQIHLSTLDFIHKDVVN